MRDVPDTPDERHQLRRVRRWKRRARILGPFLAVPLLLGVLALSVDLIEYQPADPHERVRDRGVRLPTREEPRPSVHPSLVSATTAGLLAPELPDTVLEIPSDPTRVDFTLPGVPALPPTPPYAMEQRKR